MFLSSIYISVTITKQGQTFLSQIKFLKFSRLVINILQLSCDDYHCSHFRLLNIETRCLYQDLFSLFFKVLMNETKSEGSFSDRTLSRVKLFTRWNRPAWPWFNFSWNIRVSTSFCVQLWLHSGTILWTDVRDFIYEWCNFVAYASNLLTLVFISGYGLLLAEMKRSVLALDFDAKADTCSVNSGLAIIGVANHRVS